ncbi:MAG: GAF domain-containing protein [Chloroflexota bacterium]
MTDLNLLSLYNNADITSPQDLLDRALKHILDVHPATKAATLWQLGEGGLVRLHHVGVAPADDNVFISFDDDTATVSQQAITTGEAQTDGSRVYAPLKHRTMPLGVLSLDYADTPDVDKTEAVADALCAVLHAMSVEASLQQQVAVTEALADAESLTDIAGTIAKYMARSGQYVGMNVFVYDDDSQLVGGRVIATANRQATFATDNPVASDLETFMKANQILSETGDILVSHVESETRFSDESITWLKSQKAVGLYLIALPFASPLPAFISLIDTKRPMALSTLERDVFKSIAQQAGAIIQKQQLLEASQATASESSQQAQILQMMNTLLSGQDTDSLLADAARILQEATGINHVGIAMRNMRDGIVRVVSEYPDTGLVGSALEGIDAIQERMQEDLQPFFVKDVANNSILPTEVRERFLEAGIQAMIALPMVDETGMLMGSVGLDFTEANPVYDDTLIDTAQTITSQVALSLQKTRLLEASQAQAQRLAQLTDFGQTLRAYLQMQDILDTTLTYVPQLIDADYVAILMGEANRDALRRVATFYDDEKHILLDAEWDDFAVDTIASATWTTGEVVNIGQMNANWEWKHPRERLLESMIATPLSSGGTHYGVLEIGSANAYHFAPHVLETLAQVSTQISIAFANSAAYKASQQSASNRAQANEIIAKMQQQQEIEGILRVTVEELGQAIGARRGRIRLGQLPNSNKQEG